MPSASCELPLARKLRHYLREHIADESVDLVYLDPPFNSNATYNVLFKAPDGVQSQAQIEAFDDTLHWTGSAENAPAMSCSTRSAAAAPR